MPARALSILCLPLTIALCQVPPAKQTTLIKAGHVLDVRSGRYLDHQGILVEETRIVSVGPYAQIQLAAPQAARLIDFTSPPTPELPRSRTVVMPGIQSVSGDGSTKECSLGCTHLHEILELFDH
jgi:hypothetical protein